MKKSFDLIVTRHPALVDLLLERGYESKKITSHVTVDDVRGKNVCGVLPHALSALTESDTEIPLSLSPSDRGKELTLARLREIAGEAVTYKVTIR